MKRTHDDTSRWLRDYMPRGVRLCFESIALHMETRLKLHEKFGSVIWMSNAGKLHMMDANPALCESDFERVEAPE